MIDLTLLGTSPPSSAAAAAAALFNQSGANAAAAAAAAQLLNPGELLRTSGKFTKPTKIPGKNYSKDEVVIRNADSGKGLNMNFFLLYILLAEKCGRVIYAFIFS